MQLIIDQIAPITDELAKELNIEVLKFPVFVNEEPYDYSTPEKLKKLRDIVKDKKNKVGTAGLIKEDILNLYEKHKKEKIISFHIMENYSTATYKLLREIIKEHPEYDITLIDSMSTSAGTGIQAIEIAKAIKNGIDFKSLLSLIYKNRKNVVDMVAFYDLSYLYRQGRIGYLRSKMGSFIKLIPLCIMRNETGIVETIGKARNPHIINYQMLNIIKSDIEKKEHKRIAILTDYSGPHKDKMDELIKMLKNEDWEIEHYESEPTAPLYVHMGPDHWDIGYIIK